MATSTEIALATTTLGSSASSITFSSISSAYTDLRLVFVGKTNGQVIRIRFNNDSTALYSNTMLGGDGSSASSTRTTGATSGQLTELSVVGSTYPALITVDIFNYAGSTNKTSLATVSNDTNGTGNVERSVQLYRSTSAINRVDLIVTSGNFVSGDTATLYGIL